MVVLWGWSYHPWKLRLVLTRTGLLCPMLSPTENSSDILGELWDTGANPEQLFLKAVSTGKIPVTSHRVFFNFSYAPRCSCREVWQGSAADAALTKADPKRSSTDLDLGVRAAP